MPKLEIKKKTLRNAFYLMNQPLPCGLQYEMNKHELSMEVFEDHSLWTYSYSLNENKTNKSTEVNHYKCMPLVI